MKQSIRILVKALLMVIVLLGSFTMVQAQKQKKIYNRPHCKVFLKNGKVVDSYLMAGHNLVHRTDSAIKLSNSPNAFIPKTERYYNEEIDSMLEWNDRNPEYIFRYVPVKIRYSYTEDSVTVDSLRYPAMAMRTYQGKNVDGFMVWDMWNGFRYLYKTKDMEVAHGYIGEKHRFTDSRKQMMAEEFKKYPRFVNFINSLKVNSFKDNPGYILYQLDTIIEEDKQTKR